MACRCRPSPKRSFKGCFYADPLSLLAFLSRYWLGSFSLYLLPVHLLFVHCGCSGISSDPSQPADQVPHEKRCYYTMLVCSPVNLIPLTFAGSLWAGRITCVNSTGTFTSCNSLRRFHGYCHAAFSCCNIGLDHQVPLSSFSQYFMECLYFRSCLKSFGCVKATGFNNVKLQLGSLESSENCNY